MRNRRSPKVAIVDYGMGNLYSIERACESVGLSASVTSTPSDVKSADAVILPGVGAFGDAMESLKQTGMVDALQSVAASNKPLFGICLGLQLLMTESLEFGKHQGLGIISGSVIPFEKPIYILESLKIPHIGWSRVWKIGPQHDLSGSSDPWHGTPLEGLPDGEFLYFVHSFYVVPEDPNIALSSTCYGNIKFYSSLNYKNIFACQFHPERSGVKGLCVYEYWAKHWFNHLNHVKVIDRV